VLHAQSNPIEFSGVLKGTQGYSGVLRVLSARMGTLGSSQVLHAQSNPIKAVPLELGKCTLLREVRRRTGGRAGKRGYWSTHGSCKGGRECGRARAGTGVLTVCALAEGRASGWERVLEYSREVRAG
jgi:hypothetical protein